MVHLSKFSLLAALCCSGLVNASPVASANNLDSRATAAPSLPFNFTLLFSAHLAVGKPSNYVTVEGGVLVNEPILGGTVSGLYVNGTIQGGFAHPSVYNKGSLQVPNIDIYGVSSDGEAFYIHEVGIGSPQAQVTRLEINIGGGAKYDILRNGYILASVNPNANRTGVDVIGMLVENTLA